MSFNKDRTFAPAIGLKGLLECGDPGGSGVTPSNLQAFGKTGPGLANSHDIVRTQAELACKVIPAESPFHHHQLILDHVFAETLIGLREQGDFNASGPVIQRHEGHAFAVFVLLHAQFNDQAGNDDAGLLTTTITDFRHAASVMTLSQRSQAIGDEGRNGRLVSGDRMACQIKTQGQFLLRKPLIFGPALNDRGH